MGFVASEQVEALTYDFTSLDPIPPGLEKCKGTIPEPSSALVDRFVVKQNRLAITLSSVEPPELAKGAEKPKAPTSIIEALDQFIADERVPEQERDKADNVWIDLLAEVTGGQPTRDEIAAMPYRIRTAFMKWLVQELIDPKDELSGLRPSLESVKTG